ncbi:MAG TPA: EAL domain-containing protein [Solirubrobacteraceae bacterium]|nr:EAL domain-containing protein [Solirubrobacteraceae bacterium]
MSTTRVGLLGGLSIDRCGRSHSSAGLSGRRAELVFAYLAAEHRRTVGRDELADALWPERLPETWAAALRGVMTDVRRFLESSGLDADRMLVTERGGYRLRLPDDVVVDLDETRSRLVEGRERVSAGDAAQAAAIACQVADVSALAFLPEHEGPWVQGVRDELRAIHASALELQVHALAEAGDFRTAADVAERLVRAEPFSEPAHQLRISVLADAQDRAGALKAYEHCRAVLAAELGVEPSAETEAVLRQAVGRRIAQPAPATPDPDTAVASAEAAPAAAGSFARLSVLVVEDHAFQRRTALALLRGLGVGTLAEACDGSAALELLAQSRPPDVIVCDIDMPGMDGVEFIRRVAQRGLASAVAIASGLDRRVLDAVQSVGQGYGLQVLGAVEKPLTARRLRELLEAYRPPRRRREGDGPAPSAQALDEALAQNRIDGALQPIVDFASGRMSAAQLVARWQQPGAPAIGQDGFEHLLADERLAARFVDRLTELLCVALRDLDRSATPIDLWIRLPAAALADLTLADRLVERVRGCGGDPWRIVCALGASALRRDAALHVLARLRVKGFGLCLDDFGGDRAAAQQLESGPFTAVRLAEHVICGAHGDPTRVAVLQDAIDVARGVELPVVGGGCETAHDFELLLELGCDFGQGEVIAGAMQASRLRDWAQSFTPPLAEDQR